MTTAYLKCSDKKLSELSASRDKVAFDTLIERHEKYIMALCQRYSSSFHDAEDSFQKTLLKAWQAFPRFRRDCSFKTWVYVIARSVSFDSFAKKKRLKEVSFDSIFRVNEDSDPALPEMPENKDKQPDISLEMVDNNKQLSKQLKTALSSLSKDHKECLHCLAKGMSYKEISERQNVSMDTVASRIFCARKAARKRCSGVLNYNRSV